MNSSKLRKEKIVSFCKNTKIGKSPDCLSETVQANDNGTLPHKDNIHCQYGELQIKLITNYKLKQQQNRHTSRKDKFNNENNKKY